MARFAPTNRIESQSEPQAESAEVVRVQARNAFPGSRPSCCSGLVFARLTLGARSVPPDLGQVCRDLSLPLWLPHEAAWRRICPALAVCIPHQQSRPPALRSARLARLGEMLNLVSLPRAQGCACPLNSARRAASPVGFTSPYWSRPPAPLLLMPGALGMLLSVVRRLPGGMGEPSQWARRLPGLAALSPALPACAQPAFLSAVL